MQKSHSMGQPRGNNRDYIPGCEEGKGTPERDGGERGALCV